MGPALPAVELLRSGHAGTMRAPAAGIMSDAKHISGSLEEALARFMARAEEAAALRQRLELWAAGQPQTIACQKHPAVIRKLNLDESSRRTADESDRIGE